MEDDVRRLTHERIDRGWSKAELARRARMCNGTIGQIESGRLIPYESQIVKIAEALGWPLDKAGELLEDVAPRRERAVIGDARGGL
jgi:transcriptional regulator with XRE-family HTH domain